MTIRCRTNMAFDLDLAPARKCVAGQLAIATYSLSYVSVTWSRTDLGRELGLLIKSIRTRTLGGRIIPMNQWSRKLRCRLRCRSRRR